MMASNAKGVATGTREATSAMGGKVSAPLPLSERRAGLTCLYVLLPRPTCTSFAFTLLLYLRPTGAPRRLVAQALRGPRAG